jgi:hypothetical protein
MGRIRSLGACGVLALGLHVHVATAQSPRCSGAIQLGGNLAIAGRCELEDTEVRGNVTLFAGGSLTARDVRIRGNLEGNRADFVDMEGGRVDGRVELQEFVGDLTRIEGTDLRGDVVLTGNRSRLELLNNEARKNVRVRNNSGGVLISGNSIEDDLVCTGNTPAPVGIGNIVHGDSEGQCEDLAAEAPEPTPPPPEPPPPEPTPPPEEPPPTTPPPAEPPPTTPPPTSSPPPNPAPVEPDPLADEGGGAGALGWPVLLLLAPLAAWRRRSRRHGPEPGDTRCAARLRGARSR